MYHYVYKLIHLESGEFYFGSRSTNKNPLDDYYFGSMKVWKPNKKLLKKTIIKDDFINREEAIIFESKIISKNIKNKLNRNYHIPTKGFCTLGLKKSEEWKIWNRERLKGDSNPMFNKSSFDGKTKEEIKRICDLISNTQKKNGNKPWLGKTHSEETIKLMKEKKIGYGVGISNSQFGTCWITKEGISKKIKKEELDLYLNLSWIKGRKINAGIV